MIHGIIFGGMTLTKIEEVDYDRSGELFTVEDPPKEFGALMQMISAKRSSGGHKIASYLRKHDMDVEMIDFLYSWTFEELKDLWKSRYHNKTTFIGVSVVFGLRYKNFWLFIEWIKEKYSHIQIVGGSQSLDKLLPFYLDWYVYGYGEKAILELVRNIADGTESKMKYTMFPGNRKVINAQKDYPSFGPGMRDFSVSYEDRDYIEPQELLDLEFSRGCIFKCAFCTYPILGVKNDHSRDEKNLDTELRENYDRWGTTKYTVTDETTNDYSEKLKRYAGVTRNLPFKVNMGGYIRGDLLTARKEDWPLFLDLGYMSHFYGIESMHHPSAKAIHKGMDSGKLQEGLIEFKEYAKKNHGFFTGTISLIAGLPYETFETMNKTVEWCIRNWSDQVSHVYPLHLSKVTVPEGYDHIRAAFDQSSLIESNPDKYGYTILTADELTDENRIKKQIQEKTVKTNSGPLKYPPSPWVKGDRVLAEDIKPDNARFHNQDKLSEMKSQKIKGNNPDTGSKSISPEAYNNFIPFRMELTELIWKSNTGLTMVDWLGYMEDMKNKYPTSTMPNITAGSVPTWNIAEFVIDPAVPYSAMQEPKSTRVSNIEGVTFASANNIFAKTGVYKMQFINQYKRKKINA